MGKDRFAEDEHSVGFQHIPVRHQVADRIFLDGEIKNFPTNGSLAGHPFI